MKARKVLSTILVSLLIAPAVLMAKGVGTSGGLTLIETSAARPSALGEAFSSVRNDVSAFGYNPASLGTLETGHASFMYQKGLADDAFGQFLLGAPTSKGSLGLSVGYYNGGDIDLFDGTTERTVTAQTDLTIGLGYSKNIGSMSLGVTGKYLSSELIESESATAFAGDIGLSMPVASRFNLGLALQNFGTELKFVEEGDPLPRIARAGLSVALIPGSYRTTLLLEAPYFMNEAEVRPAAGLEVNVGILSLRAGYKSGSDINEFSIGTGFLLGRSSLDYSYGLVDDLDSQHRVSLAMRYGHGPANRPKEFVKKKQKQAKPQWTVVEKKEEKAEEKPLVKKKNRRHSLGNMKMAKSSSGKRKVRRVYTVRPGDSLGKIARRMYGSTRKWKEIYSANRHLMSDPRDIMVGQRIILP